MGVFTKTDKGAYGWRCIALLLANFERQRTQAVSTSKRLLPDEDEFEKRSIGSSLADTYLILAPSQSLVVVSVVLLVVLVIFPKT